MKRMKTHTRYVAVDENGEAIFNYRAALAIAKHDAEYMSAYFGPHRVAVVEVREVVKRKKRRTK